jgi:hypothetical protein
MLWGFSCDVFGRKWAFNLTLGVTGVFGLIAAGSPNFAAIGCFAALWSFLVLAATYLWIPQFFSNFFQVRISIS